MRQYLDKGFLVPYTQSPIIDELDDASVGILLKACIKRQRDGIPFPKVENPSLNIAMLSFEPIIQNRLNGQKSIEKENKDVPPPSTKCTTPKYKMYHPQVQNVPPIDKLSQDNTQDKEPPKSPSERKGRNPQKERERELNARFELFWKEYPRKQSKVNALKAWIKIKPDDALTDRIIKAVKLQKQGDQWQRENGKFIPLATTWLNGARWEDEIQPTTDASMKQVKEQSFDVKDFMQAALARSYGDDEY